MQFFIEVVGSVDQVFVGPFADKHAAHLYATTISNKFDCTVMDENEKNRSVKLYGEIPTQPPTGSM